MDWNLLSEAAEESSEYISVLDSLLYALIGFAFVFVGILILIGILYLVGFIVPRAQGLAKKGGKKGKKGETPAAAAPAPAAPAPAPAAAEEEIPDEVKAAIVAAIMAYYSVSKPQCEFVVRKIKRY